MTSSLNLVDPPPDIVDVYRSIGLGDDGTGPLWKKGQDQLSSDEWEHSFSFDGWNFLPHSNPLGGRREARSPMGFLKSLYRIHETVEPKPLPYGLAPAGEGVCEQTDPLHGGTHQRKHGCITTSFAPWAAIDAWTLKEAKERERKHEREQQKVIEEVEERGRKQKRQRLLKGLRLSQT